MSKDESMWADKGATLSDKSARQEFGLTQAELFAAMRAGKLQFRMQYARKRAAFRSCRFSSFTAAKKLLVEILDNSGGILLDFLLTTRLSGKNLFWPMPDA